MLPPSMCFPTRRKDCQYWHRGGGRQEDQQQPQPSQLRRRPQQQQQQQGNGLGAGPGRAGHRQSQGNGSGPRGHRQQQQQLRQSHQSRPPRHLPRQQPKLESRQRQPQPQLPWLPPPPPPPPAAYPPPLLRHPGWQQRPGWQQPPPSYRDIAARGLPNRDGSTNPDHGHNLQRTGSGGFDLAQHQGVSGKSAELLPFCCDDTGTQSFSWHWYRYIILKLSQNNKRKKVSFLWFIQLLIRIEKNFDEKISLIIHWFSQ